jgi:hypothetical protein
MGAVRLQGLEIHFRHDRLASTDPEMAGRRTLIEGLFSSGWLQLTVELRSGVVVEVGLAACGARPS